MQKASEPTRRSRRRAARVAREGIQYRRWYWPSFALPGILWLLIFFLLPLYTVVSIAFGTVDPIFRGPVPVYQPWWWSTEHFGETLGKVFGIFQPVYVHTFVYVVVASAVGTSQPCLRHMRWRSAPIFIQLGEPALLAHSMR